MITLVRTASIHDGKLREAVAWAIKAASYLRDKQNTNTQVTRNIGGPVFQLHWVSTYPSLGDAEKALKQVEGDQGYQALLTEGRQQGLFVAASIVDSLYESIP